MTMEHDPSNCHKKSRKPYTLTKQRESWTNDEHERFIKALQLYNRDWKKIETYVGTKTVVQIRSHAQKYFQKVIKSGSTDAIPPPRPKRRATDAPLASQTSSAFPELKHIRLTSEGPTRAGSAKGEVDSDGGQQNSRQDFGASLPTHDAVEATAQLESARSVVSSQNLQQVYLFLASVFSQAPVNHANMLQQLSDRDRQLVTLLLRVLSDELSAAQQQQQQQPSQQQHAGTTVDSALQQHPVADQTTPLQQQQALEQQTLQQQQQTLQQRQQQQQSIAAVEAATLLRERAATPSLEQPIAAAGPGDPVTQQLQQLPAAQTKDAWEGSSGIAQESKLQQEQAAVLPQVSAADAQAAAVQAAQQQQQEVSAAAAAAAMNAAAVDKVQLGTGAAFSHHHQQQQQHKQHHIQNGFGIARKSVTP